MPATVTNALSLAARLGLAGVLAWAGAEKLGDRDAIAAAIANYRVFPDALIVALAAVLPPAEILVGLALVAGPYVQGAGLLGALLLGTFAVAMAQAIIRGIDLECGCFGAAAPEQVSWGKVAMNAFLGSLATWIAWVRPVRWRDLRGRGGLLRSAGPLVGCALVAALLAAPSARASVVLALDLAQLVQRSDHVVLATAGAQTSRWSDDGRHLVTDVSLRVEDSLKGPSHAGDVLVVTRLGGRLHDLALQVPGEANFGPGQRALVFLHSVQGGSELHVVGMAQGVLPVRGAGPDAMAMPGAGSVELVEREESGALGPGRAALVQPRPLAALVTEIRRLVTNGATTGTTTGAR